MEANRGYQSDGLQRGTLVKSAGRRANKWQARYFVLYHDRIECYLNKDTQTPKKVVYLLTILSDGCELVTARKENCFSVPTDSKVYILSADSTSEALRWMSNMSMLRSLLVEQQTLKSSMEKWEHSLIDKCLWAFLQDVFNLLKLAEAFGSKSIQVQLKTTTGVNDNPQLVTANRTVGHLATNVANVTLLLLGDPLSAKIKADLVEAANALNMNEFSAPFLEAVHSIAALRVPQPRDEILYTLKILNIMCVRLRNTNAKYEERFGAGALVVKEEETEENEKAAENLRLGGDALLVACERSMAVTEATKCKTLLLRLGRDAGNGCKQIHEAMSNDSHLKSLTSLSQVQEMVEKVFTVLKEIRSLSTLSFSVSTYELTKTLGAPAHDNHIDYMGERPFSSPPSPSTMMDKARNMSVASDERANVGGNTTSPSSPRSLSTSLVPALVSPTRSKMTNLRDFRPVTSQPAPSNDKPTKKKAAAPPLPLSPRVQGGTTVILPSSPVSPGAAPLSPRLPSGPISPRVSGNSPDNFNLQPSLQDEEAHVPATISGFLWKVGGKRKKVGHWQRRWVELAGLQLSYYEGEKASDKPNGVVNLYEVMSVARADSSSGKPNSFQLKTALRTYFFYASTDEECDRWVECVQSKLAKEKKTENYESVLWKSGGKRKAGQNLHWQRRRVVLQGSQLTYYKGKEKEPRGRIDMATVSHVQNAESTTKKKNSLAVVSPSRTFWFYSDDERDYTMWLDRLRDTIHEHKTVMVARRVVSVPRAVFHAAGPAGALNRPVSMNDVHRPPRSVSPSPSGPSLLSPTTPPTSPPTSPLLSPRFPTMCPPVPPRSTGGFQKSPPVSPRGYRSVASNTRSPPVSPPGSPPVSPRLYRPKPNESSTSQPSSPSSPRRVSSDASAPLSPRPTPPARPSAPAPPPPGSNDNSPPSSTTSSTATSPSLSPRPPVSPRDFPTGEASSLPPSPALAPRPTSPAVTAASPPVSPRSPLTTLDEDTVGVASPLGASPTIHRNDDDDSSTATAAVSASARPDLALEFDIEPELPDDHLPDLSIDLDGDSADDLQQKQASPLVIRNQKSKQRLGKLAVTRPPPSSLTASTTPSSSSSECSERERTATFGVQPPASSSPQPVFHQYATNNSPAGRRRRVAGGGGGVGSGINRGGGVGSGGGMGSGGVRNGGRSGLGAHGGGFGSGGIGGVYGAQQRMAGTPPPDDAATAAAPDRSQTATASSGPANTQTPVTPVEPAKRVRKGTFG
eukprot:TRINITY_DN7067_c0_g1_i1.p1 TRINITY_DN7067_c0_g1~~TRINITY_DN7067_c0_g1_i1.p1  ORF type:complete len:1250 (+),score=252.96 TRINITY_DN7067_c0_g1_i1:341-4090(+)